MTSIEYEDIKRILAAEIPWNQLLGKAILVTGATGMLASYMAFVVIELMRQNTSSGGRLILAAHHPEKAAACFGDLLNTPGVEVIAWDGTSEVALQEMPEVIVHAASIADSSRYLTNPVETILPNTIGTWRLLEVAREHPACKFLFFSSASAYGKVRDAYHITEADDGHIIPFELRSCYGESKRLGEALCAAYAAEYGVEAMAVRISHTYGPTMNVRSDTRVFAEFVRNIIDGSDIIMKSDGTSHRAFCYIADACEAFFRVLLLGTPGQVYNMANDRQFVSILELAKTLAGLFPERNITVAQAQRTTDDTYSENYNANAEVISANKLRSLGWEPHTSIEEGFRRTITSLESERRICS